MARDEQEPLLVRRNKGRKDGDVLERLVVLDVGEFQGPHEGRKSLGAEPERLLFDKGVLLEVRQERWRRFGYDLADFHPGLVCVLAWD